MNTPKDTRPYDWVNISFLTISPLIAVFGTAFYAWNYGVKWTDLAIFAFMYSFAGLGITAGYHRYFSHRTYDCSKAMQWFYALFGAACVENSILNWCSDHRYHHRFVDTEKDPYNVLRGGLYAHMGWIFFKNQHPKEYREVVIPDLVKDPICQFQHKYYLPLVVVVGFGLPTLLGALAGRPMAGFLWGGFLRCVIVQHMTFLINSAAHIWGTRPYTEENTARDNWMLGPITFGEGYHNFHHKFQADYRNGHKWYHFDVTKWWIKLMSYFGQTWRLKRTPESLILRAKLQVQMQHVGKRLAAANASDRMWRKVNARLELGRRRLEGAYSQYQVTALEYRRRRDEWTEDKRKQWAGQVKAYRAELEDARRRWSELMKAMNRIPHPTPQQALSVMAVVDILKMK